MSGPARVGKLLTFYSYKGGVGRSMCVANVGALLAGYGRRVLIVDWDLDAPGINRYFLNQPSRLEGDRSSTPGLVELIHSLTGKSSPLDWRNCLVEAFPFGTTKGLSILNAGRSDASYPQRVQELNWETLFRDHGLGESLERLREEWLATYDFVLVDSRTGFTDVGNICTIHLPDILVVLFTTNDQSLRGVIDVARRARLVRRALPFERQKLVVVPIPSRDETQSQQIEALEWRAKFAREMREFYMDWVPEKQKAEDILEKLRIPYKAYWSFGERLPVAERGVQDHLDLGYAYDIVARLIHHGLEWERVFPTEIRNKELSEQERLSHIIGRLEALLENLPEADARSVWSLLTRLAYVTLPGEGTADTRRWVYFDMMSDGEQTILPRLVESAVVEKDSGDDKYRLSESGLVASWPALRDRINEHRALLRLRQDLIRRDLGSTEIDLLGSLDALGFQLSAVDLSQVDRAKRKLRNRKRALAGGVLLVILALSLALSWMANEQRRLREERNRSVISALLRNPRLIPYGAALEGALEPSTSAEIRMMRIAGSDLLPLERSAIEHLEFVDYSPLRWSARSVDMPSVDLFKGTSLIARILTGATVEAVEWSRDLRYIRARTAGGGYVLARSPYYHLLVKHPLTTTQAVWALSFSPDGKTLATASRDVQVWRVHSGEESRRIAWSSKMVRAVAFSPDGRYIAGGGWDYMFTIREDATNNIVFQRKYGAPILAVAWSHDAGLVAAGDENGNVTVYLGSSGGWREVRTFQLKAAATSLSFSTLDQDVLTIGNLEGTAESVDLLTGAMNIQHKYPGGITALAVIGPGVAAATWAGLYLSGEREQVGGLQQPILDLASDNGRRLYAAPQEGRPITLYQGAGVAYRVPNPAFQTNLHSIAISPDGTILATGGDGGQVYLWSIPDHFPEPCDFIPRNLTQQEWKENVGDLPYRKVCPNLG